MKAALELPNQQQQVGFNLLMGVTKVGTLASSPFTYVNLPELEKPGSLED